MKTLSPIFVAVACICLLVGCGRDTVADSKSAPPSVMSLMRVGFRSGFTSDFVMQVDNLSATQGIEIGIHAFDATKVENSKKFVVFAEKRKDIGMLEMGWKFKVGDMGSVEIEGHPVRAYFKLISPKKYAVRYFTNVLSDDEIRKLDFSSHERDL